MKLSIEQLSTLSQNSELRCPSYDISNTGIGIVHMGPGAFHRAHQAVYTEDALNLSGGDWGICGVSLRSATARDVLKKQDNLYTLAILDKEIKYQIIGSIREVLVASEQSSEVLSRLVSPQTKLVTLTITEKGYCLGSDGSLDLTHSDIAHDLTNSKQPISAIGYLVESLRRRYELGLNPFNVLSCDNVSGNGDKLRQAVIDFAGHVSAELQNWIEQKVAFPNSMVDSITPKTEDYIIKSVSDAIGAEDEWPIQREQFTQWVIEDNWNGERPDWEKVGVVFTSDVDGFEKAKLRLLNCLHSTLAYTGSLAGFDTVYNVTSNPVFYKFICELANEEVIGSFVPPKELDVESYSKEIIERFLNPEIQHLLSQIAWDGSQKLQMRILPIIRDNLNLSRSVDKLCFSLASWMEFLRRAIKSNQEIVDPLEDELKSMDALISDDLDQVVNGFLSIESVFGTDLIINEDLKENIKRQLKGLQSENPDDIIKFVEEL